MRDGIYSFRYEALGQRSRGSLTLRGDLAHGGDTRVMLQGQVSHSASAVTASLDVTSVERLQQIEDCFGALDFTIRLTGAGSDTHFDMIGIGPRGLIVGIAGEWMAPLAAAT